MTAHDDQGSDPACWADLLDAEPDNPVLVTLADLVRAEGDGAVWTLPAHASGDLNVNLVRLGPDMSIDVHRNDEVDVLLFVRAGAGEVVVDDRVAKIGVDQLVLIPRNSARAIRAYRDGLVYLSIHRARGPMTVRRRA